MAEPSNETAEQRRKRVVGQAARDAEVWFERNRPNRRVVVFVIRDTLRVKNVSQKTVE